MAHRVISLKYRPQNFDEITGQRHVVLSLKGAITRKAVGHAYLFAGPRGVGKTTTARILAKSVNCVEGPTVTPCQQCRSCREITAGRSIDVIEIDGASNRGIDEIRNLREGVRYSALGSRYKIYIIDEVHSLTPDAFNALLKTLEEPPESVVFILATTTITKVPATILSRCQRFLFKRLTLGEIVSRLRDVAEQEHIAITDAALHSLAVRADGSIRDAESILEQLCSFVDGEIGEEHVFGLVGILGNEFYHRLLTLLAAQDVKGLIEELNRGIEEGADPLEIYRGLVAYLRRAMLQRIGLDKEFLELTDDEIERLVAIPISREVAAHWLELALADEEMMRRSINPRIALELLISRLATVKREARVVPQVPAGGTKETPAASTDVRERLAQMLGEKSRRLGAIIQKAVVTRAGDEVRIVVEGEFARRELAKHEAFLIDAVKRLYGPNAGVRCEAGSAGSAKAENSVTETIRTMFDGEEV